MLAKNVLLNYSNLDCMRGPLVTRNGERAKISDDIILILGYYFIDTNSSRIFNS